MGKPESCSCLVAEFDQKWSVFSSKYGIEIVVETIFADKTKCKSFLIDLKKVYETALNKGCGFVTYKCCCPSKVIRKLKELKLWILRQ